MIKEAKNVHLVKLLMYRGHEVYLKNPSGESGKGYYYCESFPGVKFMITGSGYTDADGKTDDTINFVQTHIFASNAHNAARWILARAAQINAMDLSDIPERIASRWIPPEPCAGAWNKTYGFLLKQGLGRDFIHKLRIDKEVFQDTRGNTVFVVRDECGNVIGHEIMNWEYYKPPTALDGSRLTGVIVPSELYGIDSWIA